MLQERGAHDHRPTPDDPRGPAVRRAALPPRQGRRRPPELRVPRRERGRTPAHPSYFLKPSSSLAASGDTVERPDGTELLGFEGEIALVIGKRAHRVALDEAWSHVGWVTAADDLGVYDLRAADRGSNVRSKGRDGFTPVGPALVDARTVDPGALRVRTWLNGDLVQDDTSAGMIFPLARIVADLAQHLTLEVGDVVLTGTPAGASVAVPGDVVEVEVDAPGAPGAPTTGRLTTRVVAGPGDFDPAWARCRPSTTPSAPRRGDRVPAPGCPRTPVRAASRTRSGRSSGRRPSRRSRSSCVAAA